MLDLGLPRALVISTLTLAATFAAGAAHAEPPAPPAAPTAPAAEAPAALPPEAKAPPAAYAYGAPPGYPLPEAPPEYPPEMRARSSGMVVGGVLLLSFGMVGLIAGSSMVGAHEPTSTNTTTPCVACPFDGGNGSSTPQVILKPGFQSAGIATLVGSVVAMGAGIPLIILGSKKVPLTDDTSSAAKAAKLTPTVHIAPASATLVWQF